MLRESSVRSRADGPGLGTRAQAVPSQCTSSVLLGAYAVPGPASPAAQTSEDDRASTALRATEAGRPGIVTGAQLVPSQCSTVAPSPTAQASEDDSALTALRPNLKSVTVPARACAPAAGAAAPASVTIRAAPTATPARTRTGRPAARLKSVRLLMCTSFPSPRIPRGSLNSSG